jgi:hypothetical protein
MAINEWIATTFNIHLLCHVVHAVCVMKNDAYLIISQPISASSRWRGYHNRGALLIGIQTVNLIENVLTGRPVEMQVNFG